MTAILKRELRAYFTSMLGYFYLAAIGAFSGLYFFTTTLMSDAAELSAVFSGLFTVVLFLIPLLTMRLFSEESRGRSLPLLYTAPVANWEMVLGKYLGALILYSLGIAFPLLFGVVLSVFQAPSWPAVWGSYLGLWLVGAALIAVGLYLSSRTQSQLIAGVCGLAISLMVLLLDAVALVFPEPVRSILFYLSFSERIYPMTLGLFRLGDAVYFLSIAGFFLYLCCRRLAARRML